MNPSPIELIGCGALAEQVYVPVLAHLEKTGKVRVTALVDSSQDRSAKLANHFPSAKAVTRLEDLPPASGALAIIATPPGLHAGQACALLAKGRHVLCEKPLTTTVVEAEKMITTATDANRLLAAGMMRRFYPAAYVLHDQLKQNILGDPIHVDVVEGGRFGWNAASPNFFDATNGGVLYDLGSHVVDLLCLFFGEPAKINSRLDTLGGTNTNALLRLGWQTGLTAQIRLSWDTPLTTGWRIRCQQGEYQWDGSWNGDVLFNRQNLFGKCSVARKSADGANIPAIKQGWSGIFVDQVENVLQAMEGKTSLLAPATAVLPSLRCLEYALHHAEMMPQPWLTPVERAMAEKLLHT